MKYFLDPPPPRLSDMNGCNMATPTIVCLYQQRVIWIFTRSILSDLVLWDKLQSNLFIENYY